MIAASSLAFPGSKTLATWWSQLAPFNPLQLWVGHLFIHRLEVLAEIVHAESVDSLHLMLLRAVSLDEAGNAAREASSPTLLERLDQRLHLGRGVIGRLLGDLSAVGLVTPALPTSGTALTAPGRQAAVEGHYPRRDWQRRELVFAERLRPDGSRLLPPHFLGLTGCPDYVKGQRWQPDANNSFDLTWLRQSMAQPLAWKETFAFPQEIVSIADPEDHVLEQPPPWQRVAIDRPERLLAAMVAVGTAEPERILIFAAQQDGWGLRSDRPIGTLAWSGRQELPDIAEAPNWPKSWQDWCQARQYPAAEVQACTLTQTGHRLEIVAPAALHARLATGKSDILKGDAWLLAGDGYVRSAANVQWKGL